MGVPPTGAASVGPGGSARHQPSSAGYWIGGVIGIVGVVASVIWFGASIGSYIGGVDSYPRVSVPGRETVHLAAGNFKIFVEYPGANLDSSGVNDVGSVAITDDAEHRVPVSNAVIQETYSWNGHEGRAIGSFTAPHAGSYTVSTTSASGTTSIVDGIAIGKGIGTSMVGSLLGSMALGAVAVLVSLAFIITTAVRRGRWRRGQQGPPHGGYAGYPMAYGAPPGSYGPPGYGPPAGGYGSPPGGYGAPQPGYAAPPGGYGAAPGPTGAPPSLYDPPPGTGWGPPPGAAPAAPWAPPTPPPGSGPATWAPPVAAPIDPLVPTTVTPPASAPSAPGSSMPASSVPGPPVAPVETPPAEAPESPPDRPAVSLPGPLPWSAPPASSAPSSDPTHPPGWDDAPGVPSSSPEAPPPSPPDDEGGAGSP